MSSAFPRASALWVRISREQSRVEGYSKGGAHLERGYCKT